MESIATLGRHEPWNKGKIVGQKAPFKLKEIWALRVRLQMENRVRELALFNLGNRCRRLLRAALRRSRPEADFPVRIGAASYSSLLGGLWESQARFQSLSRFWIPRISADREQGAGPLRPVSERGPESI
jgi:hypothetical protein